MTFNKEEVFPGTKVKLSLKASPGSVFAISAVDKSVHFLGNANDIGRGQVRHSNMLFTLNLRSMMLNSIFQKEEHLYVPLLHFLRLHQLFCIN